MINHYKIRPIKRFSGLALIGLAFGLNGFASSAFASCQYVVTNEWNTGFTAAIRITNDSNAAVNGWTVGWQYAGDRITNSWNATVTGTSPYSATNLSWNGNIAVGQMVEFGFQGNKAGTLAEKPVVTGTLCTTVTSSSSSVKTSSSVATSSSSSKTTTSSSSLIASSSSSSVKTSSSVATSSSSSVSSVATTSIIQAEDYSTYFDTTPGNTGGAYRQDDVDIQATTDTGGGYNVGWSDNGEWLGYNVQLSPGSYDVTVRVASAVGGSISVKVGQTSATLTGTVPNTGGWQTWQDLKVGTVVLASTTNSAYLNFLSSSVNVNWIKFSPACTSNCPATGITAKQAAADMGKGFNMGQMFDNAQASTSLATASAKIDAYYNKGFRNVRIPTTWTSTINGYSLADPATGAVTLNTARLNDLTAVIDYALSKPGMYVILNAHHESDLKDNNKAYVLEKLWTDISSIYKNRDHRLIFEILNEPHLSNGSAMPAANLRNMTSLAYKKIRADDAARIIAIGGNQWFASGEMAATWPNLDQVGGGNDAYLMAEFHHYDPWSFSGDNQGDYADAWTDSNVYNPMDTMLAWANSVGKGMPVFIGEWGVGWGSRYTTMSCNNIRSWYSKLGGQYAPARGMPTALWDDGGWFKVWDYDAKAFSNNLADCISGSCAWEGTDRNGPNCY